MQAEEGDLDLEARLIRPGNSTPGLERVLPAGLEHLNDAYCVQLTPALQMLKRETQICCPLRNSILTSYIQLG